MIDPRQLTLPVVPAPVVARRSTRHTFGVFTEIVLVDATGEHKAIAQICRACGCLRREANVGARLGAKRLWSINRVDWLYASPPCTNKDRC